MSDWVVDLQTQNCSHSWLWFMVSTPATGHACWCFWGFGGGVGRGGTFICTSTQCMSLYGTVRSLELSHIRDATLLCKKKTSQATSSTNLAKFVVEQEGPGSRNDKFVVVKCAIFQFWGNLSIENGPHIWWRTVNICKLPQFWTLDRS